uniref:hypothetical protein n=1 Tax=Saccharothrix mutabilis TaxID=33921 RepID=UPI0031D88EB1
MLIGSTALAIVLAVGAVLLFGGKSAPEAPKTFQLKGAMALLEGTTGRAARGECEGVRGYDDIAEGTQVTVYDATGKAIALGALENSQYAGRVCTFSFTVDEVPIGHDIYQVEVSHRGKVSFSDEAARAGEVALTLG